MCCIKSNIPAASRTCGTYISKLFIRLVTYVFFYILHFTKQYRDKINPYSHTTLTADLDMIPETLGLRVESEKIKEEMKAC